jgi:hypothetical protein
MSSVGIGERDGHGPVLRDPYTRKITGTVYSPNENGARANFQESGNILYIHSIPASHMTRKRTLHTGVTEHTRKLEKHSCPFGATQKLIGLAGSKPVGHGVVHVIATSVGTSAALLPSSGLLASAGDRESAESTAEHLPRAGSKTSVTLFSWSFSSTRRCAGPSIPVIERSYICERRS